jgi:hypothetical protein
MLPATESILGGYSLFTHGGFSSMKEGMREIAYKRSAMSRMKASRDLMQQLTHTAHLKNALQ